MNEYSIAAIICVLAVMAAAGYTWHIRRKMLLFTEEINGCLEQLIQQKPLELSAVAEDTLQGKICVRLERLQKITSHVARDNKKQKEQIQGLISDISHQLKTPVANLTMYCDTLMERKLPRDKEDECLSVLRKQVGKMDFLIRSLIKMSRLETDVINLKPEKTEAKELIEEAVNAIMPGARKKNITVNRADTERLLVRADYRWTSEALFNILDNAVKYTPDGGSICISTERLGIYSKMSICDTGIGIRPEHINDVCKRFYREEKAARFEGAGIGLYLTREILTRQSGYLGIDSKPGEGTCVSVYLPNCD